MKRTFPEHIAIIMDGNGRWARARGLKRFHGHSHGVETVRNIVEECSRRGIKELTLYAFSTENWRRPKLEVAFLMRLLKSYLRKELAIFEKNNIQFKAIGEISQLSAAIQKQVQETERLTQKNTGMILRLALSYGGRNEILHCTKKIAQMIKDGVIEVGQIDEGLFSSCLYDPDMRDPDLIIRTSGEFRLSNFLLWQSSYSEFWVTDIFWPDFTIEYLNQALADYQNRERRYGAIPSEK